MDRTRILVVDDDLDICDVLDQALSSAGHQVKTAQDGTAAIRMVREFNPHIVLLDVMLPRETGLDILKKIREIDKMVKVVMISGLMDLGTAKEAIKMGALEYITKPIDLEQLNEYILSLRDGSF